MGLFSNLFGEKGKEADSVLDKMKQLADDLDGVKYADEDEKRIMNGGSAPASADSGSFSATFTEDAVCGDSWGPVMPSEPNQFNSGLKPRDYFLKIFNEDFSTYQLEEIKSGWSDVAFNFVQNGQKKLVVELMSDGTQRYKLRNECRAQGIPYLRFYYDHDGWWNTRSYVTRRVANALTA